VALHYPGHDDTGARLAAEHAYQIEMEDGSAVQGLTDSSGLTEQVEREEMHQAQVAALRGKDPKGGSQ
jgi:type VI secretion system secreted protein VgrG